MSSPATRRLAAIVAADVVDYSRLVGENEEGVIAQLRAHRRELIDPALARHGGRVANTAGDSLLIEFASVVEATRFAIAMQEGMAERSRDVPETSRIAFRIGIHVGDVMPEGQDLLGDGVNIAARIETLCAPGSILLSEAAHAQIRGRLGDIWSDAGQHYLKNIDHPVHVWGWSPEGGSGALATGRPSIAVLAFNNMSGDPEQTYFAEGIAEDIITDLSKVSGLMVIARNSSFAYRGQSPDIRQVCRDLGVRYVLEGSVRKAGNRVRINAQMIDGTDGSHVWAERFDRDLADIFAVQDEVTAEIVGALEVRLTQGERDERRQGREQIDPEVYDLWLRGREQVYRFRDDAYREARSLLDRAAELAPRLGRVHAQLALVDLTEYLNGWNGATRERLESGRRRAMHAVELDPTDPESWHAAALANMWLRDHDAAEQAAREAVRLNPNFAGGHVVLGQILDMTGRHEQSLSEVEVGLQLDPLYHIGIQLRGRALFALGRDRQALDAFARRLVLVPNSDVTRLFMAASHGHLGEYEDARTRWQEMRELSPTFTLERAREIYAYTTPDVMDRVAAGLAAAGIEP